MSRVSRSGISIEGKAGGAAVRRGTLVEMVRRDADRIRGVGPRSARCVSSAGGSPVSVSAEAPSSRPQVPGREAYAQAGRQEPARRREPCSGERAHGPQHEVKPAASTEKQSESRAAHVTAKATSRGQHRNARAISAGYGAQHACKERCGTREARLRSGRRGKRVRISQRRNRTSAQRESEGAVVVTIAAQNNARERRAPAVVRSTEQVSAREWPPGADLTTPVADGHATKCDNCNGDCGPRPSDLRVGASTRCTITSGGVTSSQEAWKRVRAKKGAAGVDRVTLAEIEQYGVGLPGRDRRIVARGTYRPAVVLRRYIPKADGKQRPLGIPTVRDRVVQMAAKLVLEPIFEADFFRARTAFGGSGARRWRWRPCGKRGKRNHHVLDADIRDYFGSIDHEKLMKLLARASRIAGCSSW
jgi:hypothetical protein